MPKVKVSRAVKGRGAAQQAVASPQRGGAGRGEVSHVSESGALYPWRTPEYQEQMEIGRRFIARYRNTMRDLAR